MKRPDGTWIKPPPNYPPISTACKRKNTARICNPNIFCGVILFFFLFLASTHNLEEYIQMDVSKGPGRVFNLTQFVQHFYKPAT